MVIDQTWGQDGFRKSYQHESLVSMYAFIYFFFIRDGVEVHKDPKKERDQYPAILTEQAWLIKDLLYGFGLFFSRGTQHVILSAWEALRMIWIMPLYGASHIMTENV